MNSYEQQYLDLLRSISACGTDKRDRTGTGTRSLFGAQLRFDVGKEFPLLTTKKLYTRAIMVELEWMLRGLTNVQYLQERKCTIWDEWADKDGELGPVYGKQWRAWDYYRQTREFDLGDRETWISQPGTDRVTAFGSIDQIAQALYMLKHDPFSRRNVVTAWNPGDSSKMALTPCHCMFQFNCRPIRSIRERQRLLGVDTTKSDLHVGGFVPQDAPDDDSAAHAVPSVDGAPLFYVDLFMFQRSDNERLH